MIFVTVEPVPYDRIARALALLIEQINRTAPQTRFHE